MMSTRSYPHSVRRHSSRHHQLVTPLPAEGGLLMVAQPWGDYGVWVAPEGVQNKGYNEHCPHSPVSSKMPISQSSPAICLFLFYWDAGSGWRFLISLLSHVLPINPSYYGTSLLWKLNTIFNKYPMFPITSLKQRVHLPSDTLYLYFLTVKK